MSLRNFFNENTGDICDVLVDEEYAAGRSILLRINEQIVRTKEFPEIPAKEARRQAKIVASTLLRYVTNEGYSASSAALLYLSQVVSDLDLTDSSEVYLVNAINPIL